MKVPTHLGLAALLLGCQDNAQPITPEPVEVIQPLAAVKQPPLLTFSDLSIRSAQGNGDEPVDPKKDYPESVTRWDGKRIRIRGWYSSESFAEGANALLLYPRAIVPSSFTPTHESDMDGFRFVDLNDDNVSVRSGENMRWFAHADETILVKFKSNPGLPNEGWVEVTGTLKVRFGDCYPYRWAFRMMDANGKAVP